MLFPEPAPRAVSGPPNAKRLHIVIAMGSKLCGSPSRGKEDAKMALQHRAPPHIVALQTQKARSNLCSAGSMAEQFICKAIFAVIEATCTLIHGRYTGNCA